MRPIVNPVLEGVHGIPQLEEVATREYPLTILEERHALCLALLLLPSSLFSLQLGSAARLKPSSAESSQSSDEGAQQTRNRTRHGGRIAGLSCPRHGSDRRLMADCRGRLIKYSPCRRLIGRGRCSPAN
jgi:hypothetical protein